VYVVDNAGDDLAAVRHLNACGGPAEHRAVLRPTPGAGDVQTTGWDLQVATGKPPHAARREPVSTLSWEYGQAWLAGSGVTDLIVDRAHLLTRGQAAAAAGAAAKAGTALWLLWGTGIDPYTPGYDGTPHLVAGTRTQVISLWELYQRLPAAAPPLTAVAEPGEPGDWPPLPAADFPTFLAACRRYLPRAEFAQVARLYYDTAEAADAWLDTYGAPATRATASSLPGSRRRRPAGCATARSARRRAARPPWCGYARCRPRCSSARSCCPGGPARSARSPPPGCPATSPPRSPGRCKRRSAPTRPPRPRCPCTSTKGQPSSACCS